MSGSHPHSDALLAAHAPEHAGTTRPLDRTAAEEALISALAAQEVALLAAELLEREDVALATGARALVEAVDASCRRTAALSTSRRDDTLGLLGDAGIAAGVPDPGDLAPRQVVHFDLTCAARDVEPAVEVLGRGGFTPWQPLSPGAVRSHARTRTALHLVADGEHTARLTLRWDRATGPGTRRVTRRFAPTDADLRAVALPRVAWPLYHLVRPVRLASGKVRPQRTEVDAPFLGTPRELVDPLLEVAGVGPDDLLVDIGCGDGRVLLTAAQQRGCRCRGIERDPDLAERARRGARELGVADRVEIEVGDALDADISSARAVFLFLPPAAVDHVLPVLLDRRDEGTLVLAHEQSALRAPCAPLRRELLVAAASITTASVW